MALVINTVTIIMRGVSPKDLPALERYLAGSGARVIQARSIEVELVDGTMRVWRDGKLVRPRRKA